MSTEGLIRVSVCFKKNPKLTEEQFHTYWANNHGPLCHDWMHKFGLVRYVQMHVVRDEVEALSKTIGWRVAEFNGIADFHVHKKEDFFAAFADEYYQKTLWVDEERFVDHDTTIMVIGYDHIVIENDNPLKNHKPVPECFPAMAPLSVVPGIDIKA
ncbi:hypothetical protein ABW21_db0207392 [Orbilia brochopaga]|nr:hypothetical protein ABW21_db0207392 [Drechslerella brochopaga]